MQAYQHILICTDLSEHAKKVAARGKVLAAQSGATLTFLHVIAYSPLLYSTGDFAMPMEPEVEREMVAQAQRQLAAFAAPYGVPESQQRVTLGATKEEIIEIAKEISADLILVGAYEHEGLSALLGSTASALVNHVPCDLLAVRVD